MASLKGKQLLIILLPSVLTVFLVAGWWISTQLSKPDKLDLQFVRQFGGTGHGPGEFLEVSDIALDGLGRVLVSDLTRADVQVFEQNGLHLMTVGGRDSDEALSGCNAVVGGPNGEIAVQDSFSGRLLVYDADGGLVSSLKDKDVTGGLQDLAALDDQIYLLSFRRDGLIVRRGDFSGESFQELINLKTDPVKFGIARSMAVTPDGRIHVAGWMSCRIYVFNSSGEFIRETVIPGRPVKEGEFDDARKLRGVTHIVSMAVDSVGSLYVLTRNSKRAYIYRLDSTGRVEAILDPFEAGEIDPLAMAFKDGGVCFFALERVLNVDVFKLISE